MKTTIVKVLSTVAVVASMLVIATPAAAYAAPVTVAASSSTSLPAAAGIAPSAVGGPVQASACTVSDSDTRATISEHLPVHRWSGSSSQMHSLLEGGLNIVAVSDRVNREQVVGGLLAVSNMIMGVTAGVTAMSITFCPLEQAGGLVDRIAGSIGELVTKSELGLLLIVVGIIVFAAQTIRRGNAPLNGILAKAAVLGILAVMVTGSMASTGGGASDSNAEYKPGVLSPGWILTVLSTTVSAVASAPAAALVKYDPFETIAGGGSTNKLSCDKYLKGMQSGYTEAYGEGVSTMATGVPLIVSGMFEDTGLRSWRTAQFGNDLQPNKAAREEGYGSFDDQAWCRLLEWNSDASAARHHASIERSGVPTPALKDADGNVQPLWKSLAFQPTTAEEKDRSLMAWSACYLKDSANANWGNKDNWKVHPSFADDRNDGPGTVTPAECANWISGEDTALKTFKWDDRPDRVRDDAHSELLATYINTVHGSANQKASVVAAFAYPLAAVSILASFGAVAVGVIVAKSMMLLLMLSVIVMLIALLLPGQRNEKAMGVLAMAIGMTMFVFGAQLIFSMLAIITKVVANVGSVMLSSMDPMMEVLWIGASPLMAAFFISYMFKSMLGLPSPLSMKGAIDWGQKVSKGGAGSMFSGASNMLGKTENKVSGAAGKAVRSGTAAAKGKVMGAGSAGSAGSERKGAAGAATEKGGTGSGNGTGVNTGRAGASIPGERTDDQKSRDELRGNRELTKDEKAEDAREKKAYEKQANSWAASVDSGQADFVKSHTKGRGFAKAVGASTVGKVTGGLSSINASRKATVDTFKNEGIRAGSAAVIGGTARGVAKVVKTAPKAALITAGVVGAAAFVGPLALVGVAAYGANGLHKARRNQAAQVRNVQSGNVAAFAAHQAREKKKKDSASEKTAGVSPTVSPGAPPHTNTAGGAGQSAPVSDTDQEE